MPPKKPRKSDKTPEQIKEDRQSKVDDIMTMAAKKIIEIIESGQSLEWKKSWKGSPLFDMPHNPVSGHQFSGLNRLLLMVEMFDRKSSDNRFMTFAQVGEFNKTNETQCNVKKGEKAIHLLKPVIFNKKEKEEGGAEIDEDGKPRKIVFFQTYPVFHASQIEGMPDLPEPVMPNWDKDLLIENLVSTSGAEVNHGGDRAFFIPSRDYIRVPHEADFNDKESYYATLLHEWYHWTGHPNREGREFGLSFGDEKYAIEEIRAETFSVLAGMALGLPGQIEDHAAYIKSWNAKLESKEGVKEIVRGLNAAGKMLDVVVAFKNDESPEVDWWPEKPSMAMS